MLKTGFKNLVGLFFVLCVGLGLLTGESHAVAVTCTAPRAWIHAGSSVTGNIDCVFTGATVGSLIAPAASNILTNGTFSSAGLFTVTTSPMVTSPNGTVTNIVGTSSGGFTGTIQATTATIRFTYVMTAVAGLSAKFNSAFSGNNTTYSYCVRDASDTTTLLSGASTPLIYYAVLAEPTVVSCSSSAGSAPAGGGVVTLNVDCVITGGSGQIGPSTSNTFTPASIVFSNGSNTLTGALQSAITSPDSRVGGITGTSSGFTAVWYLYYPATVRAQYKVTTLSATPAGTYTSPAVTYTWATL